MELLGDIKEECIDNYTEKFIDIFHKTLNIHAPLRKQSRKETKLKNKPWLSKGILISIQQKNLLYKRALKLNDSNTWAQYKVYRNKLTHIKEYAKRLYIKNLVNDNKHDTLSLWKIINKIIHLKNVKKNNFPNKMYASKSGSAQGPQAISNLFNKYFTEIGVNLASTIETPAIIDGKFNATSLIQSSCNSFFLEPIVEEVVSYIRAMNPSKSTGIHGIPQSWAFKKHTVKRKRKFRNQNFSTVKRKRKFRNQKFLRSKRKRKFRNQNFLRVKRKRKFRNQNYFSLKRKRKFRNQNF